MAIENEPVGVFNSVFSYGKLRDGSFTYLFVVLSLYMAENIDQMHENSFFSYYFIEMALMTLSV